MKIAQKIILACGMLCSSYSWAAAYYVVSGSISHNNKILAEPVLIVPGGEVTQLEVAGKNGFTYSAVVTPGYEGVVAVDTEFLYGDLTFTPSFVTYLDEQATMEIGEEWDVWSFSVTVSPNISQHL